MTYILGFVVQQKKVLQVVQYLFVKPRNQTFLDFGKNCACH
jgi:hypothetical protein